ncbi:YihY/virulence factor BrkB family protein [Robiginitomaculum antarcticum]|uniref:YihY/virulence factor BrkB family protein n=1 Tax=Robiginitomaculum antarcticum TaxID=437507 RepID=UPI00036B5B3B|nr:YihY/virulence factor BrkB family protein [Robiginitomaculum antarcticum]
MADADQAGGSILASMTALANPIAKLRGIRSVIRVGNNLAKKNVSLVAGGVSFYAFLSIFPAIAGSLMLWGFFSSQSDVSVVTTTFYGAVPDPVLDLIVAQLTRITTSPATLTPFAAIFSLLFALWSASKAINALLMAMTSMYGESVKGGYIRQRLVSFLFTLGGIAFAILSIILIGAVPPILEALRLGVVAEALILILRWLVILSVFFAGAVAFYFVSRRDPLRVRLKNRNQVYPGAFAATLIWVISSVAFSFYLSAFDQYNETFGSLGAVAALLMWFWVSALALLVGAEINTDYAGKEDRRADAVVPQADIESQT